MNIFFLFISVAALSQIPFQYRESKNRTQVLPNYNWDIRDDTSNIRLGYGLKLGSETKAGAVFRGPVDMGATQGSCQFWQKGYLNHVDSGWNPYIVGVGPYFWESSRACGQCLLIRNPSNNFSIVSMITDFIPDNNPKLLDIQLAGSAFLASGDSTNHKPYQGGPENYNDLRVTKVECDWKEHPLEYFFDRGSSKYHFYLIIMYSTIPPNYIEISLLNYNEVVFTIPSSNHDLYGRWVVEFKDGNAKIGRYRIKMWTGSQVHTDYFFWSGKEHTKAVGDRYMRLLGKSNNIYLWP